LDCFSVCGGSGGDWLCGAAYKGAIKNSRQATSKAPEAKDTTRNCRLSRFTAPPTSPPTPGTAAWFGLAQNSTTRTTQGKANPVPRPAWLPGALHQLPSGEYCPLAPDEHTSSHLRSVHREETLGRIPLFLYVTCPLSKLSAYMGCIWDVCETLSDVEIRNAAYEDR
jgi:hypothetical protein